MLLNRLISCFLAIACVGLTIALLRPGVAAAPALAFPTPANPPISPPAMIDSGLGRPIREAQFNNAGLFDVIETLGQMTGTNIFVNWRSLEQAGIDRMAPVRLTLRNVTLGQALTAVEMQAGNQNVQLVHRAGDGIITIATIEDLGQERTTEIYDVREMVDTLVNDRNTLLQKSGHPDGTKAEPLVKTHEEALEGLEKLVIDTVAPAIWTRNGGRDGDYHELAGLLIITAPPENQREIALLLGRIHDVVKRHESLPTKMPTSAASRK